MRTCDINCERRRSSQISETSRKSNRQSSDQSDTRQSDSDRDQRRHNYRKNSEHKNNEKEKNYINRRKSDQITSLKSEANYRRCSDPRGDYKRQFSDPSNQEYKSHSKSRSQWHSDQVICEILDESCDQCRRNSKQDLDNRKYKSKDLDKHLSDQEYYKGYDSSDFETIRRGRARAKWYSEQVICDQQNELTHELDHRRSSDPRGYHQNYSKHYSDENYYIKRKSVDHHLECNDYARHYNDLSALTYHRKHKKDHTPYNSREVLSDYYRQHSDPTYQKYDHCDQVVVASDYRRKYNSDYRQSLVKVDNWVTSDQDKPLRSTIIRTQHLPRGDSSDFEERWLREESLDLDRIPGYTHDTFETTLTDPFAPTINDYCDAKFYGTATASGQDIAEITNYTQSLPTDYLSATSGFDTRSDLHSGRYLVRGSSLDAYVPDREFRKSDTRYYQSGRSRRYRSGSGSGRVMVTMSGPEDPDRKVVLEFCHLLEKSKQLFNGLRDLPQYGHRQWQAYFGRTFDVYTRLWKFQQQHRPILDRKYGLKRWQIGEIASKIGQLYYHY